MRQILGGFERTWRQLHEATNAGKTFGVISLVGDAQAREIETRLVRELGPEEMERRQIVCGDAYAFQGDERDVMFLSMVSAPSGGRSIPAMTDDAAQRRFNRRRVVVEHRLARLVQLGVRRSRYFGRAKTLFQLYLAATVANLTLVAAKADMTGETGSGPSSGSILVTRIVNSAAITGAAWLWQIWTLTLVASALLPHYPFATRGFRTSF